MSANKFYHSKWFIIIVILIIIFFLYQIWHDYYNQADLRQEIMHLKDQMVLYDDEQTALIDTLSYVQSRDFIEIEARSKLNMRKPGEQIIIVSSDDDIQNVLQGRDQTMINTNNEQSNLKRWWSYFWPQ
jgi:cell division protein FtsB